MRMYDPYDRQRTKARVEHYKATYPAGTRVLLQEMGADPRPIPAGTRGTVVCVDDMGTIHCNFDNGRRLGLIPGEDRFRRLTEEEKQEESK